MRRIPVLAPILDLQRGHLFPWLPVAFATGIGTYFALPAEPAAPQWIAVAVVCGLAGAVALRRPSLAPLALALVALLLGLGHAAWRTNSVAAPVLSFRYYGPIQGRIVAIDRSASDALRLTLDRVVLARTGPDRTPRRVRVSLHGQQGFITPEPGLTVILTGHLSPPAGPVEPGGFDFRRQAWFQRLGAVGYTRTPVLALEPVQAGSVALKLYRARMAIASHVRAAIPGREGAVAAALMAGERSGLDKATLESLRASNLAHLLAISGLHMGLLTGFVFLVLRLMFAALPPRATGPPGKKLAAIGALIAGAIYLALSGGNVATERAFIMVAVVFAAVLLDRRALTLRAVAVAALIVLVLHPQALTGPGFQMSFAATTALVATFRVTRGWDGRLPGWARPVFALVLASVVAGAATAPIAAAHFNRVPHFGLIANLLSVPLMGTIIMPAAVLAALLAPFGLDGLAYAVMRPAIAWILGVSDWVAGLDRAISHVPAPGPWVLPLVACGALWLILWQGRGRVLGPVAMAIGLALWTGVDRPPVLIADTGGLIGVMTDTGRALSKPRGDGFAALAWLENDGDGSDQRTAHDRPAPPPVLAGQTLVHITGQKATTRAAAACARGVILVTTIRLDPAGDCLIFDARRLALTGAVALSEDKGVLKIETAAARAGTRPWNDWVRAAQ